MLTPLQLVGIEHRSGAPLGRQLLADRRNLAADAASLDRCRLSGPIPRHANRRGGVDHV
jgi:hypothetical protein